MLEINKIYNMDCRKGLKLIDDNSIDCCITSPPYWGLRDYGVDGQIGLEDTLQKYIENMVQVFREIKRVLKKDGTVWLNLGDSYVGTGGDRKKAVLNPVFYQQQQHNPKGGRYEKIQELKKINLKPKDLIGIPWRIAFALQDDGWYLRSDIIWSKSNCMPESAKDRPTKAHEYIFLLSKSRKYYYDYQSIMEPIAASTIQRLSQDIENQKGSDRANGGSKRNGAMKAVIGKGNSKTFRGGGSYTKGQSFNNSSTSERESHGNAVNENGVRNKRTVWTVSTSQFKQAHFATFPEKLIEPCVFAGCPKNGIVLDPFMGSGTTALVAWENNRNYIGFELNNDYKDISQKRLGTAICQYKLEI
ncbi:DNA-methyltransferase [Vallitalea guaymasensis]|uniref:DNA-methyltransferase n=1 Tax=Vallitalea guaymasensis TaxID=1185412 RepID=UPI001BAEC6C7|nr:site-specific DNA-methyltransferase [Vallitalea guaymasensis]